jgi:type VI secretion system Hcp family effector
MAMDAFFELGGGEYEVKGETQDQEFKPRFALEVFSVTLDTKYPSAGQDSVSSTDEKPQVQISEIEFKKIIDNASPTLFLCCCEHTIFETGKFTFRKASGSAKSVQYLQIDLTKVTIQNVNWNIHGESGGFDEETVKIAFGTICMTYHPQAATGAKVRFNIKGWDLQKNSRYG